MFKKIVDKMLEWWPNVVIAYIVATFVYCIYYFATLIGCMITNK